MQLRQELEEAKERKKIGLTERNKINTSKALLMSTRKAMD